MGDFYLVKLFIKFFEMKILVLFLFVLVSVMLDNLLLLIELMVILMNVFDIILFNLMIQQVIKKHFLIFLVNNLHFVFYYLLEQKMKMVLKFIINLEKKVFLIHIYQNEVH